MGRTPGAKNRTWREIDAEGKHLRAMAKLKRQIDELKKKQDPPK